MILASNMYVPSLRWRQGEYQALLRLTNPVKDRIVPFITIPEIGFDFEEWQPKKSVQEHVHPFAARYSAKWGTRPAWITVHESIVDKPMDDGRDIFTYVFDELRAYESNAVPAVPLGANKGTVRAIRAIVRKESQGVAISLRLEDLMKPDPRARVQALASALGAELSDSDVIVDLGAPNFEPYAAFTGALIVALRKMGDLASFRNLALIGTAIPETFKDIAKGADEIPRHDWMFYQTLMAKLPQDMRRPNFGDYTIVHPNFTPVDMRKIKSAGKVVYTTPRSWLVRKGGAFRDNPAQMHDHCTAIVASGSFKGAKFSSGDLYIERCASRLERPSNQTKWKYVAINHHITHVLDDLAKFGAAS